MQPLPALSKKMKSNVSKPALFLDRDGVINKNHGYVFEQENFDFMEGIFDLCAWIKKAGYHLVVVTNQSGVGRGLFSQNQYQLLTEWMCVQFERNMATLDLVLASTMDPEDLNASDIEKRRRKPAPGMFFEAQEILNVDLANSIMIGDSLSDMEAATNAGVPNRFLLDHLVHRSSNYVVVENLIDCAEKIKVLAENRNKQIKDGRK